MIVWSHPRLCKVYILIYVFRCNTLEEMSILHSLGLVDELQVISFVNKFKTHVYTSYIMLAVVKQLTSPSAVWPAVRDRCVGQWLAVGRDTPAARGFATSGTLHCRISTVVPAPRDVR